MQLSIDRIEGKIAVCEKSDMSFIEISLDVLPDGAKEGSIIKEINGKYELDFAKEAEIKQRILEKQAKLFKK